MRPFLSIPILLLFGNLFVASTTLTRSKSTPNIPVVTLAESRKDLFLNLQKMTQESKEMQATESQWRYYQDLVNAKQYKNAIRVLEKLYLAPPPLLKSLPYHYNRAMLNTLLYFQLDQKKYLQLARMDFDNAIVDCRHFYFAYLGRAQVALLTKDYKTAYTHLKGLIDIFETTHGHDGDTLFIDNPHFFGILFLGDLYINCASILYKMGSDESNVNKHHEYGLSLLRYNHVICKEVMGHAKLEKRIHLYRRYLHANDPKLLGFDVKQFIKHFDTSNDVGPYEWVPLINVLRFLPCATTALPSPIATHGEIEIAYIPDAAKNKPRNGPTLDLSKLNPPASNPKLKDRMTHWFSKKKGKEKE